MKLVNETVLQLKDPRSVAAICVSCAHTFGGRAIGDHIASYHEGECEVCNQVVTVTAPRHFWWR